MSQPQQTFDAWCIVELFGHQKIAGRCTEQNIAGTNMLRVDVPETKNQPGFSRLLGSGAIYAINPVDETAARLMAESLNVTPIEVWSLKRILAEHGDKLLPAATTMQHNEDEEFF